ncbi:MAG: DUF4112 domain-containing protein [Bacteroidales bacterium]|nr:DUF4112 domain-containing protein [Bacteroidales bacterium]
MEELKSRRGEAQQNSNQLLANQKHEIESASDKERLREEKKERKRIELQLRVEDSFSYRAVEGIKTVFDDYYIEPILGFILPGVGDWITAPFLLPYLYISLFKIRSIPLALAMIYNWLIDACISSIPFLGDIIDFFHKGYRKNYQLIVGYVEDDEWVKSEVNGKAVKTVILIALLCVVLYYVVKLSMSIWHWIVGLFT